MKGDLFATLLNEKVGQKIDSSNKGSDSKRANGTGDDPAQVEEVAAAWNPASEGQDPALAANGQR